MSEAFSNSRDLYLRFVAPPEDFTPGGGDGDPVPSVRLSTTATTAQEGAEVMVGLELRDETGQPTTASQPIDVTLARTGGSATEG
ncbi:MAG: hypothetical protein AAFP22_09755, partial [Planctomycetota bacterium]